MKIHLLRIIYLGQKNVSHLEKTFGWLTRGLYHVNTHLLERAVGATLSDCQCTMAYFETLPDIYPRN